MTDMTPINEAARAAVFKNYERAEATWWAALEAQFGDDACNARYDDRGHGTEGSRLRKLYDSYMTANKAWHALRDPRFAQGS